MADDSGSVARGRHAALTPPDGQPLAVRVARGVDCVDGCDPAAMQAGGWSFICRYLSWSPNHKNLIMARAPYDTELRGYLDAGIQVVANWEASGKPGNGFSTGAADAYEAQRQLDLMDAGSPPVYFSIDYDAPSADQPLINAYFEGAASVLGLDRVGGYGSYGVISRLLDAGKVTWAWQCQAWSGDHVDPRIHLLQVNKAGQVYVDGTQCDVDEAWRPDFGALPRGAQPPTEEVDVGTPTDNATTLLNTVLDDPCDPSRDHKMTVSATVSWGAAHAAHARDEAAAAHVAADAAVAQIAGLQAAVSHLADVVAGVKGADPDVIKAAIREGIDEAIASSVTVTGSLDLVPRPTTPPADPGGTPS